MNYCPFTKNLCSNTCPLMTNYGCSIKATSLVINELKEEVKKLREAVNYLKK